MRYLTFNTVPELLCCLAAILFLHADRAPAVRYFAVYLFVNCGVEIAGIYVRDMWHRPNARLYNVALLLECGFVSWFFCYVLSRYTRFGNRLLVWWGVFAGMYGWEYYYTGGAVFLYRTASLMSVVFVLASLYFYYRMLGDEHFRQLRSYAPFWWVTGALFFYFGSTAINIFYSYLAHLTSRQFGNSLRYVIFNVLNILLYGCWSYAFLCRYRQRKSYSRLD